MGSTRRSRHSSLVLTARDAPGPRPPRARVPLVLADAPRDGESAQSLLRELAGASPSPVAGPSLDGKVLPCCCPVCSAPMTVRRWLARADCWNCGTSIALDLWQDPHRRSPRFMPGGAERVAGGSVSELGWRPHDAPPAVTAPGRREVPSRPAPPDRAVASVESASPARRVRRRRRRHRFVPAWLVSLLFHLALLILLALVTFRDRIDPLITLALEVGPEMREGDRESLFHLAEERFDLPLPDGDRPRNERQRRALLQANEDARALRRDVPRDAEPLSQLIEQIRSDDVQRRSFALRDPRLRVQLVRKHGGTTLTEAAVARGLRWLAAQQLSDGSWPLHGRRARLAGTSLALLPFLGAGQTHLSGLYASHVAGGLRYLLDQQGPDGDLRGDSAVQYGMYVHGQATIVLCEALAMTHDERLREPAQRAVDFIVAAQHPRGGWRYQPGQEGDTSVLGWQLMALQSARAAGLEVPADTFDLADQYLETVQSERGAFYAYQPDREPTHVMTAEALLCRMYLGWGLDHPGIALGTRTLVESFPPTADDPDYYYWYYATQAIHHVGGRLWKRWNNILRKEVVMLQRTQGRYAGSWDPEGPHASVGGRLYVTSLAVCTLEVYYRHAPIFRPIDLQMPVP